MADLGRSRAPYYLDTKAYYSHCASSHHEKHRQLPSWQFAFPQTRHGFLSLRQMLPRRSILAAPSARAWASQRGLASQRRTYSIAAPDAADPKLQAIDLSKLQVQKTTTPKELMSNNELVFGRYFTDHMLSLEWTASNGWMDPRITPYQNLSLDPATCVFHYAFEGLIVNEVKYLSLIDHKYGLDIEVPGSAILSSFGFNTQALWKDCIGLGVFGGAFVLLAYLAMHLLLVEKR